MKIKISLAAISALATLLVALAPAASANKLISVAGSAAGQTSEPRGLAVDKVSGRLYVADALNNRVDVFNAAGEFEKSFGWGVDTGAAVFESCTTASKCGPGLAGTGKGQFDQPWGIAVDNTGGPGQGDLYVVDYENLRVEKFDKDGNFILAFGGGVDKTVPGNVCTLASGHVCGAGSNGGAEGEFSAQVRAGIFVGVGPGGTVYVLDSHREGPSEADFKARLQRFNPDGSQIAPQQILFEGERAEALAVASDGSFYAGGGGPIRKYNAGGTETGQIAASALQGALALDGAGDLFAVEGGDALRNIVKYDSGGLPLRRFGYGALSVQGNANALAPSYESDAVYIAEQGGLAQPGQPGLSRVQQLDFPDPGPIVFPDACTFAAGSLGNTKATLRARVNPEGAATTFHFQYLTDAQFKVGGFANPETKATPESPSVGADFDLHEASVAVGGLTPETVYHCRVVASNADAPGGVNGPEGSFETRPSHEFGAIWPLAVGTQTANLNAEVNPLGNLTTAHFEYVDEAGFQASGFENALKTPPVQLGEGEEMLSTSAAIAGLEPDTIYHFQLTVTDTVIAPKEVSGPERVLRTYRSLTAPHPDQRAYELVSPASKNNAEVAVPGAAGGLFNAELFTRVQAAAGSGEAITYTSWTSFGDAEGAPGTSQYLARRGPGGWATQNISPFGVLKNPINIPYRGFTPDLRFGGMVTSEPPLTPDALAGFESLYLRDNDNGELRALNTEAPIVQPKEEFCTGFAGSATDGSRAFFAANGAFAGAPAGQGFSLYEWSAAGGLALVSVLPGETPAQPSRDTAFATANHSCSSGGQRPAISTDGSRAIWTYAPRAVANVTESGPGVRTLTVSAVGGTFTLSFHSQTTGALPFNASAGAIQAALEALPEIGAGSVEVSGAGPFTITFKSSLTGTTDALSASSAGLAAAPSRLLDRVDGAETVQLDAVGSKGKGAPGGGVFQSASADGSIAYFTAESKLVGGASAAPGKPDLYQYTLGVAEPLVDLTKGSEPADVRGVVGISENGAYVYFVAGGSLKGEVANNDGEKATVGESNLFLAHAGSLRFIATLADEDSLDWDLAPKDQTARVSPDGRHLAFLSLAAEQLVGFDSNAAGGHCQLGLEHNPLEGDPRCAQAFLYDADTGELSCASCNRSRARPLGPAVLPGWGNTSTGRRYLSDDGSRLFFESLDALLPADDNDRRDVYEFERPGTGTCEEQSLTFDPVSRGCLYLISSGAGSDDSYLLDASANGRDVFLATRQPLLGIDPDESFDVYDYREGGGFAEAAPVVPCQGEACLGPAPTPPPGTSPPTVTLPPEGKAKKRVKKPGRHKRKQAGKKHRGGQKARHGREVRQ